MKLEGQHRFQAPRSVVWQAVLDPQVLARVLPGCDDFQAVDGSGEDGARRYRGKLKIKVGPVQGDFQGEVTLSNLVDGSRYDLAVDGKGAPGFVSGSGDLRLEDDVAADGGAATLLRYAIDAKIGGRIATVGQRLLDSSAKSITRQALEGLDAQVRARAEAAGTEAEAAQAAGALEAPSQGDVAWQVAKDVVADLVPPARWPWIALAGIAVVVLLVFALQSC